MSYTRWQTTWRNEPSGATPAPAAFFQYIEDNNVSLDTRISTLEAGGGGSVGAVSSVAGRTGAVTLTKTDVGLINVDNTSDISKPVSTATTTAITNAVNTSAALSIPKSIATTKGDILGASASSVIQRLPIGANGQVLTANSSTLLGIDWETPTGGGGLPTAFKNHGTTLLTDINALDFEGTGVTVNTDGFGGGVVTVPGGPTWDVDQVSNSVTRLNNSFDNIVVNSQFDNWGISTPISWTVDGLTTVAKVAGIAAGTSAAQVTFVNSFQEFATVLPGLVAGDWYTISAKVEQISGSGTIRFFFCRHNFPFNQYATIDPVTITSGPHWITISGQIGFTEDTRLTFQQTSGNGIGSVWKIHQVKVQRGQGIANGWSPSLVDAIASAPPVASTIVSGPGVDSGSGNLGWALFCGYQGSYQFTLTHALNVVALSDAPDDAHKYEVFCFVTQDSVGSRQVQVSPATVAVLPTVHNDPEPSGQPFHMLGGVPSDPGSARALLPVATTPNTTTLLKFTWLGLNIGGWICEAWYNIQPLWTELGLTNTFNPGSGAQTLRISVKAMRGCSPSLITNALTLLTTKYSDTWRTHMQNMTPQGSFAGFSKPQVQLVPIWLTDSLINAAPRNTVGGVGAGDAAGGFTGSNVSWFGYNFSDAQTTPADPPPDGIGGVFGRGAHELGHLEANGWFNKLDTSGFAGQAIFSVNFIPEIVGIWADCKAAGYQPLVPYHNGEWYPEMRRCQRLSDTTRWFGDTLAPNSGVQTWHEVQTVTVSHASGFPTSGSYTLTFNGVTSGAMNIGDDSNAVQATMENTMSNINPGDIAVTGGPVPYQIHVIFGATSGTAVTGTYANTNVAQMTATGTGLSVAVTTTRQGGAVDRGTPTTRQTAFVNYIASTIGIPI